jgi:hypothetical protein
MQIVKVDGYSSFLPWISTRFQSIGKSKWGWIEPTTQYYMIGIEDFIHVFRLHLWIKIIHEHLLLTFKGPGEIESKKKTQSASFLK